MQLSTVIAVTEQTMKSTFLKAAAIACLTSDLSLFASTIDFSHAIKVQESDWVVRPKADYDTFHIVSPQQFELVKDERLAGYIDQRFGNGLRCWIEPGGFAARQNRDGQHHCTTTFVPSKSN